MKWKIKNLNIINNIQINNKKEVYFIFVDKISLINELLSYESYDYFHLLKVCHLKFLYYHSYSVFNLFQYWSCNCISPHCTVIK